MRLGELGSERGRKGEGGREGGKGVGRRREGEGGGRERLLVDTRHTIHCVNCIL